MTDVCSLDPIGDNLNQGMTACVQFGSAWGCLGLLGDAWVCLGMQFGADWGQLESGNDSLGLFGFVCGWDEKKVPMV